MGRIANPLGRSRQIYPRMLGMGLVLALGIIVYDVLSLQASHRRCFHQAGVAGDGKDNTMKDTPGNDVLLGLGGSDAISGSGGDDRLCGNAGRDRTWGSRGVDRLAENGRRDRLEGGVGDDRLLGGDGNDVLHGTRGMISFAEDPAAIASSAVPAPTYVWGYGGDRLRIVT